MLEQCGALDEVGGALVRGGEDHPRSAAGRVSFLPARRAEAPAVAGVQAGEARLGRREIVAAPLREREELRGHLGAHGVAPAVLVVGLAAARAEVAGHRSGRAALEWLREDAELLRIGHRADATPFAARVSPAGFDRGPRARRFGGRGVHVWYGEITQQTLAMP